MKAKPSTATTESGTRLLEFALLALPILALTPNFYAPAVLDHQGLATQEFVYIAAATIFGLLGAFALFRQSATALAVPRTDIVLFASLLLFILWQAVSLSWAPAVMDGVRVISIWGGFVWFLAAVVFCLRKQTAQWLIYLLSAIALILALSVIYERLTFGDDMRGIFFNHGISAELLVTILPLLLVTYLTTEKTWQAAAALIIIGASLIAVLLGLRRGAIIATVIVILLLVVALGTKQLKLASKQRLLLALALVLVASIGVGVKYRQAIEFRIQGATQLDSLEGGLTTRLRGWLTAWEMGKRHPLIGVGEGGYSSLYGQYRRYFVSQPQYADVVKAAGPEDFDEIRSPLTHNEYLQLFVELGIVGVLLFVVFWALLTRKLWRGWRGSGNVYVLAALLSLLAFALSSIFSSFSFRYTPGPFVLVCVLGIGFAFSRKDQDATSETDSALSFPKVAILAVTVLAIIGTVVLTGRNYNVLASQRIQGQTDLSVPQLDFAYYPNNPAGNERLERRYQQALALDPDNAGAHLGYAMLLLQLKQPAQAIPHAEFALQHGYSRPFAYVLLAFAHEQAGNLSKAEEVLQDCLASYPLSIFVRASYAEILRKDGKLDQQREQQQIMYAQNTLLSQSWEFYLRTKPQEASTEAGKRGLLPPESMRPQLAFTLVGMRGFHYLK
ncbi:MAG: O-antigen ligase family protein [Acidobacteria bacterium]|nr:O-antigen ligase family protein [Acidobacteriota bacterium]